MPPGDLAVPALHRAIARDDAGVGVSSGTGLDMSSSIMHTTARPAARFGEKR